MFENSTSFVPKQYEGQNLLQIALPMGGIGAGCICLSGYGGLQDFSIRNAPTLTALPDGHGFTPAGFALLHIKGEKATTRLVEGILPPEKLYDQGLQGQGYRKGGHEGLPRFKNCTFTGKYPFGTVNLSDPNVPLHVQIEGWSPFIPLDDKNSSLPCAILNYTLTNPTSETLSFEFSFHLSHLAEGSRGERGTRNSLLADRGFQLTNSEEAKHATFGSAAVGIVGHRTKTKAMWFRGGWFDSISALWREVTSATFRENDGEGSQHGLEGRNGGSVLVEGSLASGESVTIPVVISWYFPNCHYSIGVVGETGTRVWHPYYTSQWKDAGDVALYVIDQFASLLKRTRAFQEALFSSTLPAPLLDAVSANLAIVKSPTILRQSNGNLWAWEGCFANAGCCHGSCTHVWNYAQALPHLFPTLERTLREQEYLRSMNLQGHITFRSALPDAETTHDYHAASDGQLGGILKLFRDWQICGNTAWLKGLYPLAKRSLEYCIAFWDPKEQGVLLEPHHNTYDIEFWGADGMCSSVYIGALSAMALMARALDKEEDANRYEELAQKGSLYLDTKLFNGEYYEQQVQWEGLRDTSFAEEVATIEREGREDEMSLLLKTEGPKYQYGTGCISDGVIGAWMAAIYGVATPLSTQNIQSHLKAIFAYNYKTDLSEHACLQRPGYALGEEAGLLLCSWPQGNKPTLPFVYSDEVWTGIEYQVASHLIAEGLVEEGITIVEGARSRYEGRVRNPYNEYECGNYYARAMASYALLNTYAGFHYSAVSKRLCLAPKAQAVEFVTFFSTACGFGTLQLTQNTLTVSLVEGELEIGTLSLTRNGVETEHELQITVQAGSPMQRTL